MKHRLKEWLGKISGYKQIAGEINELLQTYDTELDVLNERYEDLEHENQELRNLVKHQNKRFQATLKESSYWKHKYLYLAHKVDKIKDTI